MIALSRLLTLSPPGLFLFSQQRSKRPRGSLITNKTPTWIARSSIKEALMDQALNGYQPPTTTRLVPNSQLSLKQTTNLIAAPAALPCKDVEKFLELYQDLIPPEWIARHAKFVYHFGYHHYEKNAAIARTKHFPQGYMAKLISLNFEKHGLTGK